MTRDSGRQTSHGSAVPAVLAAMAGGLAGFVGLTLVAMSRNEWVFEYALDDVYIHLSMARQISEGGYGINPSEISSASSSPLYPFLLAPFSGTSLERWAPLLFNTGALLIASSLIALALSKAGLGRAGVLLAGIAPIALASNVTAFTGMENMGHVAASLAVVLGLWAFIETGRISWLLIVGVVLSSALRLEGVALGITSGAAIALLGRPKGGMVICALALLPLFMFAAFLIGLGQDMLPNSVIAKMQDTGAENPLAKFGLNIRSYGGRYLFALSAAVLLLGLSRYRQDKRAGVFGLAVAGAGFAHLVFGSIGWMDRYEAYANASLVAAFALMAGALAPTLRIVAIGTVLLGGFLTYAPYALSIYAWNPAAITAQHKQMARLAALHVDGPVAVNDIGYVAWADPDHVLDLWGLASSEALQTRLHASQDGWAGPLAARRGVVLAMIYDDWLGEAVPSEWRRLGDLVLDVPNAFLGGPRVAFYATELAVPGILESAIAEWQTGLPPRARFEWAEGQR